MTGSNGNPTTNPAVQYLATCWTTAGDVMPSRNGDLSSVPIERRVHAAAAAGYTGFGIGHNDIVALRDGIGFSEFRRILDDSGIATLELEYIDDWWESCERRRASDVVRADLFEAASTLGAAHIKAGLGRIGDTFNPEPIYAEFDLLATQAARVGTKIALEPAAFSMTPTIEPSARMVAEVGNAAGGLLVDIWHIFRGDTGYDTLTQLLDPRYVFAVELNDGWALPIGDLFDDTFDNRQYCGEGDFAVQSFVEAMIGIGYTGPWGLEMMSAEYRTISPERGAAEVLKAADTVVKSAYSALRGAV